MSSCKGKTILAMWTSLCNRETTSLCLQVLLSKRTVTMMNPMSLFTAAEYISVRQGSEEFYVILYLFTWHAYFSRNCLISDTFILVNNFSSLHQQTDQTLLEKLCPMCRSTPSDHHIHNAILTTLLAMPCWACETESIPVRLRDWWMDFFLRAFRATETNDIWHVMYGNTVWHTRAWHKQRTVSHWCSHSFWIIKCKCDHKMWRLSSFTSWKLFVFVWIWQKMPFVL